LQKVNGVAGTHGIDQKRGEANNPEEVVVRSRKELHQDIRINNDDQSSLYWHLLVFHDTI